MLCIQIWLLSLQFILHIFMYFVYIKIQGFIPLVELKLQRTSPYFHANWYQDPSPVSSRTTHQICKTTNLSHASDHKQAAMIFNLHSLVNFNLTNDNRQTLLQRYTLSTTETSITVVSGSSELKIFLCLSVFYFLTYVLKFQMMCKV